ncbi:hypothetical protein E4U52_005845 [Claviceps spartinae]|nr:hypothetical protein E4U52_005845 [Claviceps spartinae]
MSSEAGPSKRRRLLSTTELEDTAPEGSQLEDLAPEGSTRQCLFEVLVQSPDISLNRQVLYDTARIVAARDNATFPISQLAA